MEMFLCGGLVYFTVLCNMYRNKNLPFDVSLFGGYTKIMSNIPFGLKPDPAVNQNYTSPYNSSTSFDNQNLKVGISALNFSAIASLNLPVITFYGGIGYCKTKTAMEISGDFLYLSS